MCLQSSLLSKRMQSVHTVRVQAQRQFSCLSVPSSKDKTMCIRCTYLPSCKSPRSQATAWRCNSSSERAETLELSGDVRAWDRYSSQEGLPIRIPSVVHESVGCERTGCRRSCRRTDDFLFKRCFRSFYICTLKVHRIFKIKTCPGFIFTLRFIFVTLICSTSSGALVKKQKPFRGIFEITHLFVPFTQSLCFLFPIQ